MEKREGVLEAVKVLGYLNFVIFIIGFLNSKGGEEWLSMLMPASLLVSLLVTLVYIFAFRFLPLDGKRMHYWNYFRPYVWQVVIFILFVVIVFSVAMLGGQRGT